MPKFFVDSNHINSGEIIISGENVNHIKNVLRKRTGDAITICDNLSRTRLIMFN